MIRPLLTMLFSLSALTGLALIVYGIRLKPARVPETSPSGDDIVLEFSGTGEGGLDIIELEKSSEDMKLDEKRHFDPGKHHPEKIAIKKSGDEPDPEQ
jgi:hypothetical protein